MSLEDNNITVAVRRMLSSYWIDLTRLNIRTTRGIIHISGQMRRMTYEHAEVDERILRQLDAELRLIDKVRNVLYDLEDWMMDDFSIWRRVETDTRKPKPDPLWRPPE